MAQILNKVWLMAVFLLQELKQSQMIDLIVIAWDMLG